MPKYRLAFIIFLLLIAVLLGIFDSTGTNTAPGPTKNPMATSVPNNDTKDNPSAVFVPPSSNRSIDTARAIADYITEKSNGLLAVPYTEIPDHGNGIFGVHYNAMVVKNTETITDADRERIDELVGEIFKLTTEHIIQASAPTLSHMGVQLIDSDIWWWGGHERGSSRIYIASRDDLLRIPYGASGTQWLKVARENPQKLVMDATLEEMLRLLREAEKNK